MQSHASIILCLEKITKLLTYHTPFSHWPSQSYQLSKRVRLFWPTLYKSQQTFADPPQLFSKLCQNTRLQNPEIFEMQLCVWLAEGFADNLQRVTNGHGQINRIIYAEKILNRTAYLEIAWPTVILIGNLKNIVKFVLYSPRRHSMSYKAIARNSLQCSKAEFWSDSELFCHWRASIFKFHAEFNHNSAHNNNLTIPLNILFLFTNFFACVTLQSVSFLLNHMSCCYVRGDHAIGKRLTNKHHLITIVQFVWRNESVF